MKNKDTTFHNLTHKMFMEPELYLSYNIIRYLFLHFSLLVLVLFFFVNGALFLITIGIELSTKVSTY